MRDYKSLYLALAGKVADAIELLIQAQQAGEAAYENEISNVILVKKKEEKDE